MSVLGPGDEDLHYADGSHRWMCPDLDRDEDAWADRVKAQMRAHGYRQEAQRLPVIRPISGRGNERG